MSQGTWVPKNRHKGQRYKPSRAEHFGAISLAATVALVGDLVGVWDLPWWVRVVLIVTMIVATTQGIKAARSA